jgi:hypothetical protein
VGDSLPNFVATQARLGGGTASRVLAHEVKVTFGGIIRNVSGAAIRMHPGRRVAVRVSRWVASGIALAAFAASVFPCFVGVQLATTAVSGLQGEAALAGRLVLAAAGYAFVTWTYASLVVNTFVVIAIAWAGRSLWYAPSLLISAVVVTLCSALVLLLLPSSTPKPET